MQPRVACAGPNALSATGPLPILGRCRLYLSSEQATISSTVPSNASKEIRDSEVLNTVVICRFLIPLPRRQE